MCFDVNRKMMNISRWMPAIIATCLVNLAEIFISYAQRQRSGDAPLVARTQQRLVLHFVYLIASRDAITRELLSYQEEVLS